jgi:tol-pal system protein YbgF
VVRLDRLENQIRQLTGLVEQLQYRNQQLELQLRRVEEADPRLQGSVSRPPVPGRPAAAPPAVPPQAPGRRGDAFDPAANPTAPGAPRVLGSNAASGPPPARAPEYEEPPVAPPAGRGVGAPLDLSTLAGNEPAATVPPGVSDAGPPRSPGAGGAQVATLPPTDSPKDNYDLGYGYFLRKDYALSEESFRAFLKKYPTDRLAADAQFWLGESLFQRQRWRDAAEAFLNVSTKFEANPKAPDALLRLGQALSALGEKEAACASLGEILRKYPRASVSVKQSVDREQKRVHC